MRMSKGVALLGVVIGLVWVQASHAQVGGIGVFEGETLFAEGTHISQSAIYRRESRDQNNNLASHTLEEYVLVTGVSYGFRPQLTFASLIPYVVRTVKERGPNEEKRSTWSGIGDVVFLARQRLYKKDWYRGSFNISVTGGVEFPTAGKAQSSVSESSYQRLGSGTFDPFVASGVTYELGRLRVDGVLFYKITTVDQNLNPGNITTVKFDAGWRALLPKVYPGPSAKVGFGLAFKHEGVSRLNGTASLGSGSRLITIRPKLSSHPRPNWDVELSADIPVHEQHGGEQLKQDPEIFLAFGYRF